jgi:hypothetical protein
MVVVIIVWHLYWIFSFVCPPVVTILLIVWNLGELVKQGDKDTHTANKKGK